MSNEKHGVVPRLRRARIAISGKSGCGNSTVSRMVGERLRLRVINYTFHDMAKEMGVTFEELCERAEGDMSYDIRLDQRQRQLAAEPGCVLGSRLAVWVLKDADLKVYLVASPEVRARRIAERERAGFETVLTEMTARDRRDRQRYKRLYNIDNDCYDFCDIIVETNELDQFRVTDVIIRALKDKSGMITRGTER